MTYPTPNRKINFIDLGIIPYKQAWDLQESYLKELVDLKIAAQNSIGVDLGNSSTNIQDTTHNSQPATHNQLLFCEHPHVYTLGKSGKAENLLIDIQKMQEVGAEYFPINRGGDITYHGPGQLVAYPILDLENFFTDIHRYMRSLEEAVIQTCQAFGLLAGRVEGLTGVWIDPEGNNPRKICALGVKTSRWVTIHGLAFNVNTNLDYFGHIVPCGITDKAVTSLQKELGKEIPMEEVKMVLKVKFCDIFEAKLLEVS